MDLYCTGVALSVSTPSSAYRKTLWRCRLFGLLIEAVDWNVALWPPHHPIAPASQTLISNYLPAPSQLVALFIAQQAQNKTHSQWIWLDIDDWFHGILSLTSGAFCCRQPMCVCVCVRKSHDIKAQYTSGLFVFVSFVFALIFPTFPRIIVACWGWGALMRGVSWMKSAKRRSVKIHRERSAACVVYYDIHHMAACHWTWRGNPNSPLW